MENSSPRDVREQLLEADSPMSVLVAEMKIQAFDRATDTNK